MKIKKIAPKFKKNKKSSPIASFIVKSVVVLQTVVAIC